MAKAKAGAKKATPAAKKPAPKAGLLQKATKSVAKAAKVVKAAAKKLGPVAGAEKAAAGKTAAPVKAAPVKAAPVKAAPAAKKAPTARTAPVRAPTAEKAAAPERDRATPAAAAARVASVEKARVPAKAASVKPPVPVVEKPAEKVLPRNTRLPSLGEPLTKREMEQLLTAGQGRGVVGEGSLKGRLIVRDGLPHLLVAGRDKRELTFLLQGPSQETLPDLVDQKVSVTGLIRKTSNYGGTVDVRKFASKRPEEETAETAAPAAAEPKLRYLSPGEVSQATAAGMGAGIRGFASIRGQLEMTGEEFIVVVSNAGTRQQVSFVLQGKATKGLRKMLGQTVQVTGVVDKTSGWGGRLDAEVVEPRPAEFRPMSREGMEVLSVEEQPEPQAFEARVGQGVSVRVAEKPGFIWAIEPTAAKRASLREVVFEPQSGGPGSREFFFTPRNVGPVEIEFFLAKAHAPAQVDRSFKLTLSVRP